MRSHQRSATAAAAPPTAAPARGAPGRLTGTLQLPARKATVEQPAAGPDADTLAAMDSRNRGALDAMFDFEGGGFARADEMMTAPLEVPHRAQMEAAFGEDFGGVQAHLGVPDAMGSIGARAAARGDHVAFAETAPSAWLVAHELTHVAQARQGGDAGGAARSATIGAGDDAAEREADAVADRVASGMAAGPISAAPSSTIRRFSQEHHESATVQGLNDDFSAEEIGQIYAANWERDFSQSLPEIANVVIAWEAVKNAKVKTGSVGAAGGQFQGAASALVNLDVTKLLKAGTTSLGGYQPWEHMDAPAKEAQANADARWAGKSSGLAGYINDAKAHIKDQMVAAVDTFRGAKGLGTAGDGIDNWNGALRPAGYAAPTPGAPPSTGPTAGQTPTDSRDPIRERAADKASDAGAPGDPKHDKALWAKVGQFLGRAMHAFEDFWAHSNWLELATEAKHHGHAASNGELKTGEFGLSSQAHSLGHKLVGFSSSLQRDFDTLLEVYGRKAASTHLDRRAPAPGVIDKLKRGATDPGGLDADVLYGELDHDGDGVKAEMASTALALGETKEKIRAGKFDVADVLCNRGVLAAIEAKGQKLIAEGDAGSTGHDHGKIAKDAPEAGKGFSSAHALATQANAAVFGPLREIMDKEDADVAVTMLETQLALVDTYLQAPSASHPLWGMV